MAFCAVCGVKLEDNASFCPYCGTGVSTQVVYVQQPPKPKAPGRGMGLASMIVGIFAAIYAGAAMLQTILYLAGEYVGDLEEGIIVFSVLTTVLSALALIFQAVASSKGYKRKTRLAGLILSISSLAVWGMAVLLALTE